MSELNMSLEYLPITNELKDVSSLKNRDEWIGPSSQDLFNNPRFQLNSNTTCTIQTSRNGDWYVAFVRISEQGETENTYNNTYFKAFSPRQEENDNNAPVCFDRFQEFFKDPESGKWIRKI